MTRSEATKACPRPDDNGEGLDMVVMLDATGHDAPRIDVEDLSAAIARSTSEGARGGLIGVSIAPVEPRSRSASAAFGTPSVDLLISKLKGDVELSGIAQCSVADLVIRRLLSAWQRDEQRTDHRPDPPCNRSFKRAKAFIEEHIAEKLLVSDVAKAAGVSVRRLQMVFQKQTGQTPMHYILDQRLNRVRADLRAATPNASSINTTAARWGFTHMGDFSRRYRARFGEVPSLTRRR